MSVGTAKADADLRKIEDRVKALEAGHHVIKISAVFDDSSVSKAKAAFASLDNSISKDAMQRLRSSPQGSVLGALNALFSPHPVSGAPSPQQAASQGLLGKMFGPSGGGSTAVPAGGSSTNTVIRDVVTGQNAPQKTTVNVTQAAGTGSGSSSQAAQDMEDAATETRAAAGDLQDAADKARGAADAGKDSAGRSASAADKAGGAADEQKSAARDLSGAASGVRGVFDSLRKMFGGGGSGGGGAAKFAGNLAGGIGPGILGVSAKTGLVAAGAGSLLGSLPALLAPLLGLGVGAAGAGVAALGAKELIGSKNVKGKPPTQGPLYAQTQTVMTSLQATFKDAASALVKPLQAAFSDIPGMLKGIEPALKSVFAGAGTLVGPLLDSLNDIAHMVLPALGQAFRAAAPLLNPLLDGFGRLVAGLLPGITTLLRAALPAVTAFSDVLGTLGADLGKMFADLAPAIKASVQIFQPLMGVLSALFPIVGKLAQVFAQTLGPVFSQLASVVRSMLPFLTTLGNLLASLAGAVLGDLVSAFTAVASLLKAVAPALAAFATALSAAFTVLENSGAFAVLGDALENIVPLLATLVNQILRAMTPLLPPIVDAFDQLSKIMITALADGLQQILPPLTQLAITVLQALATSLPVVLPVLGEVFGIFTAATADAIAAIVQALSGLVSIIPKPALETLAGLAATLLILKKTGVISLGFKLVGAGQKIWQWLTGATVDVAAGGMQRAGDTMATAAAGMQRAADTMAGAGAAEETAGAEQGAAGTEEVAAAGLMSSGLGAALTAALPALGALTLALLAYEGIKSGSNILNYIKGPQAKAALTPGGTVPGAFTIPVPQSVVNKANAQNAAANASAQGQGLDKTTAALIAVGKYAQASASYIKELGNTFAFQASSAQAATTALSTYTASVKTSGTESKASQADAAQLVFELESIGLSSTRAQGDVDAYTSAIRQNGIGSSQAQAARQQLITDILGAGRNARQGHADLSNYTTAVQDNGTRSDAARSARAKLITDLEHAGLNAQTARSLVDNLGTAIGKLHGKNIAINMRGDGSFSITQGTSGHAGGTPTGGRPGNAAGGYIAGGTTGTADDVPINVSRGEYVVKASSVAKYGQPMMDAINAGNFAQGGPVSGNLTPGYIGGMYGAFQAKMTDAMVSAMRAAIKAAKAAAEKAAASVYGSNSGPVGGDQAANAALARSMYPAWASGALWAAWDFVAMRECVPVRTQILTRRGWLSHDEVQVGDETIGYDLATGHSTWTRITDIQHYDNAETIRFGNAFWAAECTPEHRWLMERMFVDFHTRAESVTGEALTELQNRERLNRVVLSRPAQVGAGTLPVSVREAALLGWIAGDGSVSEPREYWHDRKPDLPATAEAPFGYRHDGQPRKNRSGRPRKTGQERKTSGFTVKIVQSKPEHFAAIDEACADDPCLGKGVDRTPARRGWQELHWWRLSTAYSRDLLDRAGNPKTDAVAQVLAMSDEQREAWLAAIIAAEGTRSGKRTLIYQDDGPVADAIEIAVYLAGHRPSRVKDSRNGKTAWRIGITSPYVGGPSRRSFTEGAGYQDVWCVTTELGTWTAEQDGQVFLTGNSGWNRFAKNPSSGAYGIPQALPESKLPPAGQASGGSHAGPQISWMHDYMAGRYGGPGGAAAHERSAGWYAGGGLIPGSPAGIGGAPGLQPWWPFPFAGLPGILSGASGGSSGPAAGSGLAALANAAAGYPGITGAFGLTRSDLGLPATTSPPATGTAGDTGTGTGTGTGTTTPKPAPKPVQTPAQKAATAVLEHLIGGYIWHNKLAQARQANTLLDWLGISKYNSQLSQVSFLDSQLLAGRKAKRASAVAAAEHLLASYGVHVFSPQASVKGNAPKTAVVSALEALMKADIRGNNLTGAKQVNSLLTHLGTGKYTSELSVIGHLDSLLAAYRKKKDTGNITATETLLRQYGVQHFAQGGTVWEPVTGFGHRSGRVYQFAEHGPEHVTPGQGGGGDKATALLSRICTQLDQLTGVAAAIPRGTGEHVGAALGSAAQSASFRSRYPQGGW